MRRNYLWYQFFRYAIVRPALKLFYSECTVSGTEHIPQDKPVIFVPNHQNSFIDALHIVCNTRLFLHFLTRAEPFEIPVVSHFLRSLNLLPVYRVRDGFSSITKTEETFQECYRHLGNGDSVLVFAEANHDLKRRVRPLSKGFTRIAFGAEKHHNWDLDLQVMPVGLNYGDHRKSRTPVHIAFGECIPASNFRELYLRDERKAANELKRATSEGLKKLTMHVPNLKDYPLHHLLLDKLEPDRRKLIDPQTVNKRVSIIEKNYDSDWTADADQVLEDAETHNIDLQQFVRERPIKLRDILFSPVYLFSLVNNILPYQAVRWITEDYIEDHVFDASAKFLSGLLLLPLYYLIICTLLGMLDINLPILAGYCLLSVITAPFFVDAKDLLSRNIPNKFKGEKEVNFHKSNQIKIKRFAHIRKKLFGIK